MSKIRYFIVVLFVCVVCLFGFTGCSNGDLSDEFVLRIYNWQEYIDDGEDSETGNSVMDDWVNWYYETYGIEVSYVYDTFETNETMLNTLKTGKTTYDLVCPSDYVIQKMIRLDMLDKLDFNMLDKNGNKILDNYSYVSKYLTDLFEDKGWTDYAIPYMWGTMGFIYNMDVFEEEDVSTWNVLWETDCKASAKDSMRDTYVVGVMYVYQDELNEAKKEYENGVLSTEQYNAKVESIMNRCDDDTLELVKKALTDMKNNIYSFEVDNGKNDIVTGKIDLNFAWSGDAVFSMDTAENEEDLELGYSVPLEGSNVWFDGWVMPKGANKELAQSFINYLCRPEIAVRNMNYIGYTSSIVGDEILDMIDDWYGVEDGEEGFEVDLTYLFEGSVSDEYLDEEGRVIVTVAERGRQFDAQYPTEDIIVRCGIMEDFGDQNEKVIAMWESVKIGDINIWITIVLVAAIVIAIGVMYGMKAYTMYQRKLRKLKYQK